MALSSETYTGNGSNRDFVVPFPYISRDHVSVSVNGTGVSFVWITAGQVRTDVAPANGATVKVQRTTPTTPLTDFADGDGNYEAALDIAALQPLYVVQEVQDFVADAALGGASAVASSITFAPAGTLSSTNVQAAVLEAMSDLRAELAPITSPSLLGSASVQTSLSIGAGQPAGGVRLEVFNSGTNGQARFRHSAGLGLLINQSSDSGPVLLLNQDNDSLRLGANNVAHVEVNPSGLVNFLNGSGAIRMNGAITRAEVLASARITATNFNFASPHGGPRRPDIVMTYLRCEVADHGYAVGAEIAYPAMYVASVHQFTSGCDATNVFATNFGNFPAIVQSGGGGAPLITNDRWRIVWRCIWL